MSKANRRYLRTIILGVLAMGGLIWSVMDQFNISPQVIMDLFLATALGAGVIILAAGLVVMIWAGLRKLNSRKRN